MITVEELMKELEKYPKNSLICNYYGSSPINGIKRVSVLDDVVYIHLDNEDD